MNTVTLLGFIAGTLTTFAFLPQVVKTWRTKSSGDLSIGTMGMICTGVFLWLLYGLLIEDLPLIATNAVTLLLVVAAFVLILTYRKRDATPEPE